jgi:ankyrin repeat protein
LTDDDFRLFLESGDVEKLRAVLQAEPARANASIRWYLDRWNESDPLHFVADAVGNGWLTNGREGEIAALLFEPGADPERTAMFGARALHWAAWTGEAGIVAQLIARKVEIDPTCSEFGATPLFWAVHGYGPQGPREKKDQVDAARRLIEAGAKIETTNKHGHSARALARECARRDMSLLLEGSS